MALTLGLAAAGCVGDDGPAGVAEATTSTAPPAVVTSPDRPPPAPPPAPPSAPPAGLDRWASAFCGSLGAWSSGVDAETRAGRRRAEEAADLVVRKAELVGSYRSAGRLTDALITDLQALGPPDIATGDELQAELVERFQRFREQVGALADRTDRADATDPAAFRDTVTGAAASFHAGVGTIADAFAELDQRHPDGRLQQALAASCAGGAGVGAPG